MAGSGTRSPMVTNYEGGGVIRGVGYYTSNYYSKTVSGQALVRGLAMLDRGTEDKR